ncbi:MAG: GNAT family N-acetyltransferase [Bdellovibrionales bacterium]|nr:GNAT family N-acetyltransferase [Bdellovibrionales bacterium]
MLKIEKASREDMKQVAKIIRSSAEWYKPFVHPEDLTHHYVDDKWIKENFVKRNFYIAKKSDKEVGTISTQFFGATAYLGYIYLDINHVGHGYGRSLIDHAKKLCLKMEDVKSMVLIAHPRAQWAIRAYEKYGFKKIMTNREEILSFNNGFMKPYYEEGFHLYQYKLSS